MKGIVLALVTGSLGSCSDPFSGEATILGWRDDATGINYRVTTRPVGIKTNSKLYVESPTLHQAKEIDDDAMWGTVSLLKYDNWILVLDDAFVLAGYDQTSRTLYGENEWSHLPFTVRKRAGTIVVSRGIGKEAVLPAMFPRVEEK
jgi:hypothetical protein